MSKLVHYYVYIDTMGSIHNSVRKLDMALSSIVFMYQIDIWVYRCKHYTKVHYYIL